MKRVFDWLGHRTGCGRLVRAVLFENIPGGARWRHAWGAVILFALAVEFITGFFLWLGYSPGSQTAWESVYYIQNHWPGGWLLRGLHHFMADALIILLALHWMQLIISGAYKAPREVNYWVGLLLLLLVIAAATTGYLLPWDQHGYWGTKVRLGYVGLTPGTGPAVQKLAMGGADLGSYTLTRFFAIHAGLLPAALVALVIAYWALVRRHGYFIGESDPPKTGARYWPDQALRDGIASLAVTVIVLIAVHVSRSAGQGTSPGAALGAPADAFDRYDAARPEWYFQWLFQFLKYFPGTLEVWGAVVIPSLLLAVVFLMPFAGQWKLGHRFNVAWLLGIVIAVVVLTGISLSQDRNNLDYRAAVAQAERDARRVRVLANAPAGIPPEGALTLLREDAFTQGPKLFAQKCASCHRYGGEDGTGRIPKSPQSAADLKGFGTREWLAGLLTPDGVASTNYFGGNKHRDGKMVKFVKKDVANYTADEKEKLRKALAAISAEAQLKSQVAADQRDAGLIAEGRAVLQNGIRCTECHQFHTTDEDATAPVLTGYGSRDWLVRFIGNPAHPDFYGDRNDRMPAFGADQVLDARSIGLLADWLRGEWYEP
jgi:ubiquinol-cytochrome c reductase cytochrome b subunit